MDKKLGSHHKERGAILAIVAISLPLIIALVAFAIDINHLYVVRNELQNAADSGAIAGANELYNNLGTSINIGANQIAYDTAKTVSQLDGVLYLGNVTGGSDVGWQKYANNATVYSTRRAIEDFDVQYITLDSIETGFGGWGVNQYGTSGTASTQDPTRSYRYIPKAYNERGYQRDEVYASSLDGLAYVKDSNGKKDNLKSTD